jgi:ATP-dependent DNA helicase RecG
LHGKYLVAAGVVAALILTREPTLAGPRGEALRHLLYIFGKDEAVRLIRAG